MPSSKTSLIAAVLFVIVLLLLAIPAGAQAVPAQPYAAIASGEVTLFGLSDTPVVVNNPAHVNLSNPVWSPSGDKVAYTLTEGENYQSYLMIADTQGNVIFQGTEPLELGFPITFTPDGAVLYVIPGIMTENPSDYQVTLKRIVPTAGAVPEVVGQFKHRVGCGGFSMLPTDWQYSEESGELTGNGPILAWTAFGIVHTTHCNGAGLALFDPNTGTDTLIGPDYDADNLAISQPLGRAQVSPDGGRLVAMRLAYESYYHSRPAQLVLVDLATMTITDLATSSDLDYVAWGSDNTLFYSTRTQTGDLTTTLTAEQKTSFAQIWGNELTSAPIYEVGLWQLNLEGGQPAQQLYSAPANAIVRMQIAPDGSALYFGQIANLEGWAFALLNGAIDPIADATGIQQRNAVPVILYRLPLGTGETPTLINTDARQFILQP